MKVCFFILGIDYSGAEIVLNRYINNNKEVDPYFIIIYENKNTLDKFIDIYGKQKIFPIKIRHNKNILRFMPYIDINKVYKKCKKIISEIKPDLIYANNTHEMMLIKKVVKNTNIPTIAHIHDMRESVGSPIKRYFMEKSIDLYDNVITVSQATKESWKNEKCKVIYNGVEDDFYLKEIVEKEKISVIGYIGKISDRKGFDLLRDVFDDEFKNIKLLVAYNGVEEKYKRDIENMSKKDNVKFLFNLNEKEIIEFYDEVDLLVVPSRQDPLPTVIMEAMARGCIVIGAKTGGISELLCNENLLFEVNNREALKIKINELINEEVSNIKKYQKELYNLSRNKFSHKKKLEDINKLLK